MERFLAAGYRQIGMDHFALPDDELARASAAGTLHRNFMGYTTRPAADMVACGVSGIGDVSGAFAQNVKKLSTYYEALDAGRFPIERGYRLDADDRVRRDVIANLMCNFHVDFAATEARQGIEFGAYFARGDRRAPFGSRDRRVRDDRPGPHRRHRTRPALRPKRRDGVRPASARDGERRQAGLLSHGLIAEPCLA